jgi:hypothetical protein
MKKLKLYEKSVYGRVLICVTDPDDQTLISGLTGRKTLTERDLKILEALGIKIDIERLPAAR